MFLAVIVQSLTIGLPIAAGICCYKYLNEKKEKTNENEQKCHHTENKTISSPVKYANMLKRPAVFQKVRMNADRTGKYEGRTRTDKPGNITLV